MNFFPNMMIPNGMTPSNVDNPIMYMNNIYNIFNDLDNRLRKLEQRIMQLENKSNNLDYKYQEPDNSMYML